MPEMKDRLKELRKALGLKQREIAEKLGVRVSAVGDWEVGRYPIPRARVYQLCHEYNVRREWLERGEGEMFQPKPTEEDMYVEVFTALYDALPENFQQVFLRVAQERLGLRLPDPDAPEASRPYPDPPLAPQFRTVADANRGDSDDLLS